MHIAIAGNIGAGKTTLTSLLAKHYHWEAHYEDVVDNPYLDDFYHQMERWSFNLQIYSLTVGSARYWIFANAAMILSKTVPFMRMRIFLRRTCTKWG